VRLADSRGTEENHVLLPLDEAEIVQALKLLAPDAWLEAEVQFGELDGKREDRIAAWRRPLLHGLIWAPRSDSMASPAVRSRRRFRAGCRRELPARPASSGRPAWLGRDLVEKQVRSSCGTCHQTGIGSQWPALGRNQERVRAIPRRDELPDRRENERLAGALGQRLPESPLLLESENGSLSGGAVDAAVGVVEPLNALTVQVTVAEELAAVDEVVADLVDRPGASASGCRNPSE
jgi:hypothetical protein